MKTNVLFENRKRKVLKILEHLPYCVFIFSPLIRRQAKLEEAVNKRLEILESNLLQQIKSVNTNVNHNQDGLMTPKSKAIDQIQKQLEASHAQLKELASRHMVPAQAPVPENSDTNQDEKKVLQGKNEP